MQGVASGDAGLVAVATDHGEVVVVDVATRNAVTLPMKTDTPKSLAMISSGTDDFVAVYAYDRPTQIYRVDTGRLVTALGSGSVEAVGTTDGNHVVTSDVTSDIDGQLVSQLRVWDIATGAKVAEADVPPYTVSLQFYHDSVVGVAADVATGYNSIVVWDWTAGSDPVTFAGAGFGDLTLGTGGSERRLPVARLGQERSDLQPRQWPAGRSLAESLRLGLRRGRHDGPPMDRHRRR